jgi:hypothetical protein
MTGVDGRADERGDHALRHRLDVGVLAGATAVQIPLEDQRPLMTDEQAVKAGNVCGGCGDRVEIEWL